MNSFIVSEIESYFKFLSARQGEIFTCTVMNKDSSGVVPGFGKWFVTVREILEELPTLISNHGGTLHVSLNQTNLTGRRSKDIQACRVLCVDLDRTSDAVALKELVSAWGVQLIVESSPGRHHLYWRVSPALGLDTWRQFQLGLAQVFEGDKNLCDITHNIRVPGVERVCKDGSSFMPSIVYLAEECPELGYDNVLSLFPLLLDSYEEAQAARQKATKRLRRGKAIDLQAGARELGRNKTLYTALVGLVVREDQQTCQLFIEEKAKELNLSFDPPMEEWEVLKIAQSAWDDGCEIYETKKQEQLDMLTPVLDTTSHGGTGDGVLENVVATENGHGPGGVKVADLFKYDYSSPLMQRNKYTEKGIADRVVQRFADSLIRTDKNTHAFNSKAHEWRVQGTHTKAELAVMTEACAMDILNEPEFARTFWAVPGKTESLLKKRQAEEKIMTLRLHAQTINYILNSSLIREVSHDIFDAVEWMYHCRNGLLDMRTEAIREAISTDYLLARASVNWNPQATCSGWLEFLAQVFAENKDPQGMVNFMQELFGYSISGSIREQKLFLHSGDGCNGKSKVLSALSTICGDYATYTDPDELVRSKTGFTRHIERFGAKLEGKRVVIIDDIDVKTNWNEAFVKSVTSPMVRARGEYEKSRLIANRSTLHLALNMMPSPDSENYGLLRRMGLIPYNIRFEPNPKKNMEIDEMISREAEGILVWAVKGYQRFYANGGLSYPKELDMSVEEYRQEHFKLETVIEHLFSAPTPDSPGTWEFTTELTNDVNRYLRESGETRQVTPTELGIALKRKKGFEYDRPWDKERKNNFPAYKVVLKFERTTNNELKNLLK